MKKNLTSSRATRCAKGIGVMVLSGLLLSGASTALAQTYTKTESFQNATAPGFILGGGGDDPATPDRGRAILTAGKADAAGQGYLQLTSADLFQVGYVIDNTAFSTKNGFSVAFDYGAYGSTTSDKGDGICAFFVDGGVSTKKFSIGGSGGSLGYAPQENYPVSNGVSNGYLGIGLDEFGNFSNNTYGHAGGPGRTPNAVAVRGAGHGDTGYPYLAGTKTLDFAIAGTGASRATFASADPRYRRAYIDVKPVADTDEYTLTVRIQHGMNITTVLADYALPAMLPTLRFGVSAATGGNGNIYEIRNVLIQADAILSGKNALTSLLSLYPNPAAGNLTLDMTKAPAGTYTVRLVDVVGRLVQQQQLAGGMPHQLNVQALSEGEYFVLIQGQGFQTTLPLVRM